jgi:quinol monooxygenase YgiN
MLATIATLKVKEGQEAEFEAAAKALVEAVNANEPGCLLYTLNKGDEPLTYVFIERYENEAAVEAHRNSDHFKTLGRAMGPFMDGRPDILRLKEV